MSPIPIVLSNWFGNQILHTYFTQGQLYLAAHTADPTPVALLETEVGSGGYVRQPIRFGNESGKTVVSNSACIFTGMPACVVSWLALWDAIAAGHLITPIQLPSPITVTLNGQLLVASGDIALSL